MKAFRLLAAALVLFAPALRAGTFSTAAWTNDATSGITAAETTWAYHLGSTTPATVNGKSVTGIASVPVTNADFDLTAPTPEVFNNDTNNLTSLTGTGSAVIARDFVYSNQAGGVMSVTVKGLAAGTTYTVSFLSVGWEAAGARLLTFASGADSRSVDQGQFGDNNGIRIDYTFTATAATRLITLTPQNASFRFHLYGLALRAEAAPTTVTTTADSGPGSLRWALVNAAERSGADTVTFDSALSGQTITLGSEIVINDSAGVTVDASGLSDGIIVSGGNAKRLLSLSSGSVVTLRRLTLTGGTGVGPFDSGRGGAVYVNLATLTLDRCTLRDNTGLTPAVDGGGIYNSSGTVTLTGCTLSGNTTSVRGGALHNNFGTVSLTNCTLSGNTTSTRGGGIFNKGGTLTLTHCTVAGNSATDAASGEGGGIFNDFAINCTLDNSIVATNTAGSGFGAQILQDGGTLTRLGANLVSSLVGGTDLFNGATLTGSGTVSNTPPNLAALAANGGPTQTMLPNTGSPAIDAAVGSTAATDQRGLSRPQGGAADIGAVEVATASTFVVQNTNDFGPGSLRQTLADAAVLPGEDTITFASGLSGQIITLGSEIVIADTAALTVDASSLPGGLTLTDTGNVDHRLLSTSTATHLTLRGLTLAGGGGAFGGGGGSIYNQGNLTLTNCTISGSTAGGFGGAIFNSNPTQTAVLSLTSCTLANNSGLAGGAIFNDSSLTLTNCTLSGNAASGGGGGIYNGGGTVTLTRSIVAGNTAPTDANISSSFTGSNNLTSGDPLLAPLGNYGGPTQTMPPLPGSPATDAGGTDPSPFATDQRGAPRVADGDGNGSAFVDIGAVEFTPAIVTSAADSGTGSLREALAASFTSSVVFAPGFTGPIVLGSEIILTKSVIIDASPLPSGVTINGGLGTNRIFTVNSAQNVTLTCLTLTGGKGGGALINGAGGAILNNGILALIRCTLSGNTSSISGGAIRNVGNLTLTQCTLHENSAGNHGGAIYNTGRATLVHCTVSANTAAAGFLGGGIHNFSGILNLTHAIVAQNITSTQADGPDIYKTAGTFTPTGVNLIGDLTGTGLSASAVLLTGGALLAPPGDYGGPTQTMPPQSGSPAIDAAVGSTATTDQRGLSRPQGGAADIGAVEVATASTFVVQNNADAGPGSLRQAIADAAVLPGEDTITFAPSLSGQTILLTSGQLALGSDVTIDATALTGGITISGNSNGDATLDPGESRLFDIPAGVTATFRRLNLINGVASPLEDSVSGRGGAIRSNGQLTVEQCVVSSCRAFIGGALAVNGGSTTIAQSTLSGNSAAFGGGIRNDGTLTVAQCALSGNSASHSGGGIYNEGTVTLAQSTVSGNSAADNAAGGGGIYNNRGTLTVSQCTLSGNSANLGGGIRNFFGTLTVAQSTLSGNSDGGIRNDGTLTLNRSIVAGNTGSNISEASPSGANNLTSGDPLLAPLGNYGGPTQTMPPLPGSPALDAGGSTTDTTDQRGAPRVADGDGNGSAIVDIGSVEVTPAIVTSLTDSGSGSLRAALADPFTSTVFFAPALAGGTITLTSGQLTLSRSVAIDASGVTGGITISGNSNGDATLEAGESRLFDIPAGVTVVLRKLNLINGIANPADLTVNGAGGAIRSSGQLTVDQCAISACRASLGGGIYNNSGGTATLTQSTLSGNSASEDGGGIYNFNGGTVTLTQSTLSGNSASEDDGGGIYNTGGTVTLTQSTLSGNSANSTGGGIYNAISGTVTLTQSTLSGNSANIGGGISNGGGTLTVTQSTLSGNSATNGGGISSFLGGTVTLNRSIVGGLSFTGGDNYTGADNLTFGDPLLAPLGNYGGPTQTMPPLPGSPAIDAGGSTTSPFPTDQRGALRVADGDGNGSAIVDIGAVEAIPALVTNANDSGAGSLRAALAASSTDIVLFDPSLSGQTITLTTGQLTPSRSVGIDATRFAGGLTISGGSDGDATLEPGESRLFDIPAGMALALRGLNLINGIADPAMNDATGAGGAIRNSGQLTLDLCAISACRARFGGAINSSGVLTARRSTFQQNTATFGGAIHSAENGLLTVAESTFLMNTALDRGGAVLQNDADSPPGHPTLTRCTFHGNAAVRGGAVNSFSLTNLLHCTLSGNSASGLGGGGVLASATSVVNLTNCVVAGNNGASPDLGIEGTGTYTTAGVNLVGNLTGSGLSAGPTLLTGDPLLAPIADYGGPTLTRALLPGSPARNATPFFVDYSDQRGFPIVGQRDLGAYEAGTLSDFDAFAIETPGAALSPTGDADNDGRSDLLEYATQSDPNAPSSSEITPTTTSQNAAGAVTQANVTFPTRVGATDLIYTLQRSTTLGAWTTVATWNATTGVLTQASGVTASRHSGTGLVSVTDTNVSGEDRAFYRLDVQQAP